MKVDRPKIMNTTESTNAESANEPVQAPRTNVPKTDSVETKENSFYNFESSAPKLDPSQTNVAKPADVAAGLIPGVPFREKVELAKTLPDGKPVDAGVTTDPGVGKTWTGPNRMGVDIAMGGVTVKNQLNDALKLRQGSDSSSAPSSKDTFQPVTANQIGSHGKVDINQGLSLKRPGMNLVAADGDKPAEKPAEKPLGEKAKEVWEEVKKVAGEAVDDLRRKVVDRYAPIPGANELLDGPGTVEKVTGDATDLVRGGVNVLRPDVYVRKFDEDKNKYVNPEGDGSTIPAEMTPELMEKINIRKGANIKPSNEDIPVDQIDSSKLKLPDQFGNPQYDKVKNPLPDGQSVLGSPDLEVIQDAKGPDTVNPNDPDQ